MKANCQPETQERKWYHRKPPSGVFLPPGYIYSTFWHQWWPFRTWRWFTGLYWIYGPRYLPWWKKPKNANRAPIYQMNPEKKAGGLLDYDLPITRMIEGAGKEAVDVGKRMKPNKPKSAEEIADDVLRSVAKIEDIIGLPTHRDDLSAHLKEELRKGVIDDIKRERGRNEDDNSKQ